MIDGKKRSRENDEDPPIRKENRSEMHYVTQLIEALEKSDDALLVSLEKKCQFVNCLGAVKEEAVAIVTASLEESPLKTVIKSAMRDITQENIPAIVDCLSERGNDELLAFYLYCFDITLPTESVLHAIDLAKGKRNTQAFLFSYLRDTRQHVSSEQGKNLIDRAISPNEKAFISREVLGNDFYFDQDLKKAANSLA